MQMKNLAVLVALPIALVACGGGGGGSSSGGGITTPGGSINSQFIDAPVKGLKYTAGSNTGITGDNGYFPCNHGQEVTFAIHDREIGKANCGAKIYISEMTPAAGIAHTDYAAALIQSLSKTSGGMLDLSTFNAANISLASINLADDTDTDTDIAAIISANSSLGLEHVPVTEAREHVAAYLPDLASDTVMADLAVGTSGGRWVTLNGAAGNSADSCWQKISAKIEVDENVQSNGKKNYSFNVLTAVGHDDPNLDLATACSTIGNHECLDTPAPRYFSGRSLSISEFDSGTFIRAAASDMVCWVNAEVDGDEDFYYMEEPFDGCDLGEEVYKANKSYELPWSGGYLVNISITDAGYSIAYKETGVDIEPEYSTFDHTAKTVGLKSASYNCSYSLSEQF